LTQSSYGTSHVGDPDDLLFDLVYFTGLKALVPPNILIQEFGFGRDFTESPIRICNKTMPFQISPSTTAYDLLYTFSVYPRSDHFIAWSKHNQTTTSS
jgi:hypothetical protein